MHHAKFFEIFALKKLLVLYNSYHIHYILYIMAFTILSASQYTKELKVRIQSTGRLGFSSATQEVLRIDSNTYITLLRDTEAKPEEQFAMVVQRTPNKDAFQAILSSGYYYLATTNLFDALKIDYTSEAIYFNLKRASELDTELGGEVYLMHQRSAKGRRSVGSTTKKTAEAKSDEDPQLSIDIDEE